jgi:thiol-disulfide isomerase/thioredoxin
MVMIKTLLLCLAMILPLLAAAESDNFEQINSQQMKALLASEAETVKVVNVWATWCAPCVREFPLLLSLKQEMDEQPVTMILISADFESEKSSAITFLASQGVDFQTYWMRGDTNEFINTLSEDWTGALPATFIFSRSNELLYFYQGELDMATLKNEINQGLAEDL